SLHERDHHRDQHTFPTRRSSDLQTQSKPEEHRDKGKLKGKDNPLNYQIRITPDRSEFERIFQLRHLSQVPNGAGECFPSAPGTGDRKSTRLNSSHVKISYAVFCL